MGNKPFDPKADKKFSAILHRNIDEILRTLFGMSVKVEKHDETTDWIFYDYVARIGEESILVEGEVKTSRFWEHGQVKYKTVDVPARKGKNSAKLYILLSSDEESFWVCPMKDILESPKENKWARAPDGKYRDETFFKVPHSKGVYYFRNLDNLWMVRKVGLEPTLNGA